MNLFVDIHDIIPFFPLLKLRRNTLTNTCADAKICCSTALYIFSICFKYFTLDHSTYFYIIGYFYKEGCNIDIFSGESNVYTLGTIGNHRVVTTKLPSVGRTREAMTAAGNTTTRLLGIFQKVTLAS